MYVFTSLMFHDGQVLHGSQDCVQICGLKNIVEWSNFLVVIHIITAKLL